MKPESLKQVKHRLQAAFALVVAVPLTAVLLFESDDSLTALWAGSNDSAEFALVTAMELLTLALLPLSLRLFVLRRVRADLRLRHADALLTWGLWRLALLACPLWANTFLYYMYLNTSFGYLAIVTLLCLPFVWPSGERCRSEAFMSV